MRLLLGGFGLAIVLVLGAAGCAEESPPAPPGVGGSGSGGIIIPPPTGGSSGSGGSGGGAGGVSGQGGTAGGGMGGAGGTGGIASTGACDNESDFQALATFGSGSPRTLAAAVANAQCSDQIADQDGFVSCVARELAASLSASISTECATCYGELAWCSLPASCNVACQNDACLAICLSCAGYDACVQALGDCTGDVPQECQDT